MTIIGRDVPYPPVEPDYPESSTVRVHVDDEDLPDEAKGEPDFDEATALVEELIGDGSKPQPWDAYGDEGQRALAGEIATATSAMIRAAHWAGRLRGLPDVEGDISEIRDRLRQIADELHA